MIDNERTSWAILFSALLHIGLVGLLVLTTLPCSRWEKAFSSLGLSKSLNPITCQKPLSLQGSVIQATLVGPTAVPLPSAVKLDSVAPDMTPPELKVTPEVEKQTAELDVLEAVKNPPPPPPVEVDALKVPDVPVPDLSSQEAKPEVAVDQPELEPIKTLSAPPKKPDVKDQEKVVAKAEEQAKKAKKEQQEKERQRMAEIEAKKQKEKQRKTAQKKKANKKKLDAIFKQLDQLKKSRKKTSDQSDKVAKELAEMHDSKKSDTSDSTVAKHADQRQTGTNGKRDAAYKAAIQNAITRAWHRPDHIPAGVVCPIHIQQIPGGQVVKVTIDSQCPFDAAGKRSVKNAVLRAEPLPYNGFESSFRSNITLNFSVEE